jgi:hypothetical protein
MTPPLATLVKLRSALAECDRHLARLRYASGAGARLFPLDAPGLAALDDPDITLLDQMLFRFGKLQDAMGGRLFPALLEAGQDWRREDTFLDRLNRLEQLGAIADADAWVRLRELRNNAMHEYPDQPDLNAANLNRIHAAVPELASALASARAFAGERFGA